MIKAANPANPFDEELDLDELATFAKAACFTCARELSQSFLVTALVLSETVSLSLADGDGEHADGGVIPLHQIHFCLIHPGSLHSQEEGHHSPLIILNHFQTRPALLDKMDKILMELEWPHVGYSHQFLETLSQIMLIIS